MKVSYEYAGQKLEGEPRGLGAGMFLLTNHAASFSLSNVTKYNGLIRRDGEHLLRGIENLFLPGLQLASIRVTPGMVERRYAGDTVETFRLKGATLHYTVTEYRGEVVLDFDMRRIADSGTSGRRYAVKQDGDTLFVTYAKYKDDAFAVKQYDIALEIKGVAGYRKIEEWQERHYPYDERRGENGRWWIYRAGAIQVQDTLALTITLGAVQKEVPAPLLSEKSLQAAFALAALDSLASPDGGILAGQPWFAQQWSRDELVSFGAQIAAGRYSAAKAGLQRYVSLLEKWPALDAYYPSGGLPAADSLGWLCKRLHDLLLVLDEKKQLKTAFSPHELEHLRDVLGNALLRRAAMPDALVPNGPRETWMDTTVGNDERAGYRIEIQAGRVAGYALMNLLERKTKLFGGKDWRKREAALIAKIRQTFFIAGRLADGIQDENRDDTARPNVFLAYYLAPQLLSPDEWTSVFDHALARLWLDWGGLASIDKEHPLYCARYSGADNRSYHRGDSWYWTNCLAAICLRRLNPNRYATRVTALRDAAVNDLFFHGALGHASELSSAAEQEWGGCFAQAWSAALLYELLKGC